MFVAYHFDPHSTTNHPTSPSSDPFPCSLSPAGPFWTDLASLFPRSLANLPRRIVFTFVADWGSRTRLLQTHASPHRPYSVLLVLSRFNNAGLSPALISAPWRTRDGLRAVPNWIPAYPPP